MALVRLARLSNLPTVWSNVLAASVLAGGIAAPDLIAIVASMSAFYTGGMILNDAFDREIDARERPERPLPAGHIAPATAWISGSVLLAAGVATLATFGTESTVAALALAGAILIYDAWHKGNPFAPFIMGACRALVYIATILAAGVSLSAPMLGASLALLFYITGLSFAAWGGMFQSPRTSWPAILLMLPLAVALFAGKITLFSGAMAAIAFAALAFAIAYLTSGGGDDRERAVALLIAAVALMDAVVASVHGGMTVAIACVGLFILTLALQRIVPGT